MDKPNNMHVSAIEQRLWQLPKFVAALAFVYVLSFAFEGVVRYSLAAAGVPVVLYLRDLIPLLVLMLTVMHWIRFSVKTPVVLVFLFLLAIHTVVGVWFINSSFQQAFGVKMFMPMILGMCLALYFKVEQPRYQYYALLIFMGCAIGIFVNYGVVYPWEGETFETVFAVTEQSRNWTASGVRRLAGLSRASFDAASVILITVVLLTGYLKSVWLRLVIFGVGLSAIYLTTSKGALLALLFFFMLWFVSGDGRRVLPLRLGAAFSLIFVAAIPLWSLSINVDSRSWSSEFSWWASSFVERIEWMWPRAFSLWVEQGSLLFGRGPGGIGVSQGYGEFRLVNAGDNFFVYWLVTFGIAGVIYLFFILYKFIIVNLQERATRITLYGVASVVLIYGLTANCVEQPILSLGIGYVAGRLFSREPEKEC